MKNFKVGFLGVGNMGEAMIKGLTGSGFKPADIVAYDVDRAKLDRIGKTYKVRRAAKLADALLVDAAVVAVKPQAIDGLLKELAALGSKLPLLISIAAGVRVSRYRAKLKAARVVRAMPNTPALIGEGVSGWFAGPGCKKSDLAMAQTVLGACGAAYRLADENLLNAVTGLSGSGPAFVFVMIEAMADAGVLVGLPRALALELAARTVAGAGRMVIVTGEHPAVLKDKVASPGGTTIAGLVELEDEGFRGAVIEAVSAAAERAWELGGADEDGEEGEEE